MFIKNFPNALPHFTFSVQEEIHFIDEKNWGSPWSHIAIKRWSRESKLRSLSHLCIYSFIKSSSIAHYITQIDTKLAMILLPRPLKCYDCGYKPPYLAESV